MKIFLFGLSLLISALCSAAQQTITLYAYHDAPPFVIDSKAGKGLNFDFFNTLKNHAPADIRFEYQFITRPELNKRLAAGLPTIALWANPVWFKDTQQEKYLWSRALFSDKDVVIARKGSSLLYHQPSDLNGLTVGTRTGYYYAGVSELMSENKIQRMDVSNDKANIEQLIRGDVDAIIISKSSFFYYAKLLKVISSTAIVGQPHSSYKRHLLISRHYQAQEQAINDILLKLSKDENWRFRLTIYGLQELWGSESQALDFTTAQ
ncbi:transporter substrate-binding domain-containing protein [Dasania sp. GY-MA-18]|uniref:Transporter substrate-binding domain-containing protein n=1 Tax=Dasania phycosphaerae TaxID=2950436 RepID=A0A9J6RH87_9GAMM|nr:MULTISPECIES: transporter substrate-binding domain-containing protein [Dasania]MCR8921147.1 transporter substrate-binding domain-containing protein [Dasania sp. GY-MA-18]MCZ0863575.1 transporter substrate-binding domain-containing protein [Dasania phycosphaerae]MCZ0867303.1 transporter substrate-binding domain-containing protein [Dasania phycosphaerae]